MTYNLMLLAAGLGTRLRPYTDKAPKPAIPFFGVPLGFYPLALMEDISLGNLVVNTHHLPAQIEALYQSLPPAGPALVISPEPRKILGSGGGIRKALPHLTGRGSFIVANADEIIFPENPSWMTEALKFHDWHKGIATLVTMEHPEVGQKFGGLWGKVTESGQFEVFEVSKKPIPGLRGLHFLGLMIFRDRIADYFSEDPLAEENILYETLARARKAGEKVFAFNCVGPTTVSWFETGNPQDFRSAARDCAQAILQPKPPAWANFFAHAVRKYGSRSPAPSVDVIEEPSDKALVQKALDRIFSIL
jgi:mannose-1-phosphate guanylyltransferase